MKAALRCLERHYDLDRVHPMIVVRFESHLLAYPMPTYTDYMGSNEADSSLSVHLSSVGVPPDCPILLT